MPVENVNEIDSLGIDNQSGVVILSIIDGLDWKNEQKHLIMLQEKINTYLRFLESGEVYSSYPNAEGRSFEIRIFMKYDIPNKGIDFVNRASEIINGAGFKLSWKIM